MKIFEILQELQKYEIETWSEEVLLEKMATTDLLHIVLLQKLNL